MSIEPQLDLFSGVLHAYAAETSGVLDNPSLYANVASTLKLDEGITTERAPVGKDGNLRNLYERKLRWYQQTLKSTGILEHVEGHRGVWGLTNHASKDLNSITNRIAVVGFSTDLGIAILGSCDSVFAQVDAPITLCVTSPPFPLARARAYGNPSLDIYVDWICKMLEPVVKNLVPGGSICLNVSNDIFIKGSPARSTYREELVLALHKRLGLWKMDELIWRNRSKAPGPIQYASIERTQLNVEWEPVYWMTNDPFRVKSDNRRVLQEHSQRHLDLSDILTALKDGASPGQQG